MRPRARPTLLGMVRSAGLLISMAAAL